MYNCIQHISKMMTIPITWDITVSVNRREYTSTLLSNQLTRPRIVRKRLLEEHGAVLPYYTNEAWLACLNEVLLRLDIRPEDDYSVLFARYLTFFANSKTKRASGRYSLLHNDFQFTDNEFLFRAGPVHAFLVSHLSVAYSFRQFTVLLACVPGIKHGQKHQGGKCIQYWSVPLTYLPTVYVPDKI